MKIISKIECNVCVEKFFFLFVCRLTMFSAQISKCSTIVCFLFFFNYYRFLFNYSDRVDGRLMFQSLKFESLPDDGIQLSLSLVTPDKYYFIRAHERTGTYRYYNFISHGTRRFSRDTLFVYIRGEYPEHEKHLLKPRVSLTAVLGPSS